MERNFRVTKPNPPRSARAPRARRLAAWAAGAAAIVALPSAGYAVGLLGDDATAPVTNRFAAFAAFTPASGDPRVAQIVAERSGSEARFVRFTPAGVTDQGSRSVTVAVRVDQELARAISVRSAIEAASEDRVAAIGPRIAPTRYNLGLARGYSSFARTAPVATPIADAGIPDLAAYAPSAGVADKPSRFAARVQLEDGVVGTEATRQLVRRQNQPIVDQSLDVAGSYRLTRNLDVTAGVRYSQERDRLAPLPDIEEQDSQAIYIGTQFRF